MMARALSWVRPAGLAALLLGAVARFACAQSLTAGTLSGTVSDSGGTSLGDASITVSNHTGGLSWSASTPRDGRFVVPLLPPGAYDVLVERLGYRPKRVRDVPVRAGLVLDLPVALVPAPPPVEWTDSASFRGEAIQGSRAGISQWFPFFAVADLPAELGEISELGRLSTVSTAELETEGLPARLSGIVMDGIPFRAARHPSLATDRFEGIAFPLAGVDQAELVTNGADVEWSEFGGGYLSGYTRRGTGRFEVRAFGDWTGAPVSGSKYFDTGAIPHTTTRAGATLSGSVIRDTAQFVLGAEAWRVRAPLPRPWEPSALDAALLAVAQDSFGVDLGGYMQPRSMSTDVVSGFGRFDWQIAPAHVLSVRANVAHLSAGDLDLGALHTASLGASLDGEDVSAAATLTSLLSRRLSHELRFGLETSSRDYETGRLPATSLVDGGFAFGSDPALPGSFSHTAIRLSETVHLAAGAHALKLGGAFTYRHYDQEYSYGREGDFIFAGDSELARREGVFEQVVGPPPMAKFSVSQIAAYFQDSWTVEPGLRLLLGLRYEAERLPRDEVQLSQAWLDSTGLANTNFDKTRSKVSPRFGFVWAPLGRHEWMVRGEAGIYHDLVDPGILGEVITHVGGLEVRRGLGMLGTWPAAPDSVAASVRGASLTLLGPQFQPPRTGRASLGITRALGTLAVVHLVSTYRHTEFLPRRRDLNLLPGASAHDQYGRPIYGTLVQQGSVLAVTPGSNRRFPGFDLVSALNVDGYSNYWGVTVAFERYFGRRFKLLGSYTYSQTRDNWLSGRGGNPEDQLTPFPDGLAGTDWAAGRSDFDVPHRLVVATELDLPAPLRPRVTALYRYRSGYPFTPGFRDGVDANGDGSARNDPTFVDDGIPGVRNLFATWDCLRGQAGRFAERNSCREPGVHTLDLRFALDLFQAGRYPLELVVDAFNVLESDVGVRDRALYVVDRGRTLTGDAATGLVTVPLLANPNFGGLLARRTTGRWWRIGLRVNY